MGLGGWGVDEVVVSFAATYVPNDECSARGVYISGSGRPDFVMQPTAAGGLCAYRVNLWCVRRWVRGDKLIN